VMRFLACGDPHHLHRVADHVGWAPLASEPLGIIDPLTQAAEYRLPAGPVSRPSVSQDDGTAGVR
jgi:hypothetical protein